MFRKMINNLIWCLSAEGKQSICHEIWRNILFLRLRFLRTKDYKARQDFHLQCLKRLNKKYPQSKYAKQRRKEREEHRQSIKRIHVRHMSEEEWAAVAEEKLKLFGLDEEY